MAAPSAAAAPGLAKGALLVAGRDLVDPNFNQSVVLLVDYGDEGAMGLVLNRPTAVGLREAIPELPPIDGATDRVYEGGPVSRQVILVLVESEEPLVDTERVLPSLWVSGSRALLEELAARPPAERRRFRIYSGYAGWAPGQLDGEIARGGWHLAAGDRDLVFDTAPETLWRRVIERELSRWAGLGGRSPAAAGGAPTEGFGRYGVTIRAGGR